MITIVVAHLLTATKHQVRYGRTTPFHADTGGWSVNMDVYFLVSGDLTFTAKNKYKTKRSFVLLLCLKYNTQL